MKSNKKVTTNMSVGQVIFVLAIFTVSSLMFFYLGAKFGSQVFDDSDKSSFTERSLLPSEALTREVKSLLSSTDEQFVFHQLVEETSQDVFAAKSLAEEKTKKIAVKKDEPKQLEKKVEKVVKAKTTAFPKAKTTQKTLADTSKLRVLLPGQSQVQAIPVESQSSKKRVFRLQLGSFLDRDSAVNEQKKWKSRGYTVHISESKVGSKTRYRVRMGYYKTEDDVNVAKKRLKKNFRLDAKVVEL